MRTGNEVDERDELKPCPCCGSRDVSIVPVPSAGLYYRVACNPCGLRTQGLMGSLTAKKAWNRRPEPEVGGGSVVAAAQAIVDAVNLCDPYPSEDEQGVEVACMDHDLWEAVDEASVDLRDALKAAGGS